MTAAVTLRLTADEAALVCEALDSHAYWQLSDEHYRRDGYVNEPGSDDADNAAEIRDADALRAKVVAAIHTDDGTGAKGTGDGHVD